MQTAESALRANLKAALTMAQSNQNALNAKLFPDWSTRGFNFPLAVVFEAVEALGHTNWSWWKTKSYKQPLSPAQVREINVELCDLLHFGLSCGIVEQDGKWLAPEYVEAFEDAAKVECDFQESVEALVIDALLLRTFNVKKFARACVAIGLTLPRLLAYYFAKSELNTLRWGHGYAEGKYVKMWDMGDGPKEDNTHLAGWLETFLSGVDDQTLARELAASAFQDTVYGWLLQQYGMLMRAANEKAQITEHA